ncbi:DNA-binding protein [Phellopilus nigrolimitatus]|nr:DNA-binding protein [Phellopilus nigrolimitatus]
MSEHEDSDDAEEELEKQLQQSDIHQVTGLLQLVTSPAAVVAIIDLRAWLVEVAVHTILYIRQIYPADAFAQCAKYGIPVFQCQEPLINDYVSEAIKAIGEEIVEDNVASITISIHSSGTPLEKFVFFFDHTKQLGRKKVLPEPLPLEFVQRQLRSVLLKLNAIDSQLLPLDANDDLSFSFVMKLREEDILPDIGLHDIDISMSDSSEEGDETSEDLEDFQKSPIIADPALVHVIRTGIIDEAAAKRYPRGTKEEEDQSGEEDEHEGEDDKRRRRRQRRRQQQT